MIVLLVSEIEGGSPERHGEEGAEEEGLVLEYSSSWILNLMCGLYGKNFKTPVAGFVH